MSLQKKKLAFLSIVNQIKGFVRGVMGRPPLTLPNCVDNKSLIDYKIYGDSVQENRNLLLYDIKTTTSNGTTWTVNNDRSITVTGTPTAYSGFALINQVFDPDWVGKTLTFYYTGVDIANASPVLNMYRADGTNFTGYPFNHTLASNTIHTITVPEEAVKIKITIQRGSNNIECTGTIYPMLLMGEYTAETLPEFAKTFPAPDNPMEIESVGEKTKNLFDCSQASVLKRISSTTVGFENSKLIVNKTSSGAMERIIITIPTPKANTDISVSITGDVINTYGLYMSDTIPTEYTAATDKTLNTGEHPYINISISIGTSATGELMYYILLKEGSTIVGDYEPFGYKIPIKAIGAAKVDKQIKNLVTNSGSSTLIESGVDWEISRMSDSAENITPGGVMYSSGWRRIGYYDCQPDKWYKVSYDVEYLEVVAGEFSFPINHRLVCGGIIKDVQIQEFNKIYHVDFIWKNTDADNHFTLNSCKVKVTNFKLYESDNEIKESLTNIYTKEPIRRIFNTLDTYADVVDLANKKIIRNIASVIPESSKWVSYNDGSGGKFAGKRYGIVPNAISGAGQYFNCICDKFPSVRRNDMYNIGQQGIAAGETVLRLIYPGLTDLPDADFRAWADENPIQIDYILAEPIEEIIDTSTLPTFKGTTIYEIDTSIQPSNMEVTYYSTSKE